MNKLPYSFLRSYDSLWPTASFSGDFSLYAMKIHPFLTAHWLKEVSLTLIAGQKLVRFVLEKMVTGSLTVLSPVF
jgi:hypothetical protein